MSILLLLVILAAFFCDRVNCLKSRPWLIGVIFGILGIAADPLFIFLHDWGGLVRDAPPIAAALYFGPAAGIVAGVIAAAWSCVFPSQAASVVNLWLCPFATLITAVYAAAVRRWFFDSKRPAPLPAAIVAAFGEITHLAVDAFSNTESMSQIVGIGYWAFANEVVAYVVLTVLVAFVCGACRGWRRNFLSGTTAAMTVFAVAFGLFAAYEVRQANVQVDLEVDDAQRRLEHDIDDQLGFMLHCNSESVTAHLKTAEPVPFARMRELAQLCDVDILHVVGRDGVIVASTDESVLGWDFRSSPVTSVYMGLVNGTRTFVKQHFRQSQAHPEIVAKYIGTPFPDGSGFIQLGYLRSRLEREFSKFFIPMLEDMSVGASGYYVVANLESGRIAADAAGHRGIVGKSLREIGLIPPPDGDGQNGTFTANVFGQLCRCRGWNVGDWCVYCVVPAVDAYGSTLLTVFFVGVQLLVICMAFQIVGQRFREARAKIELLRANEDARREKDLGLAQTIQHAALPSRYPDENDFRVYARMDAAKEVGGDFYDFFALPSGEIGFLIADVSGKSVPGAMFMMQAKMVLRTCLYVPGADLAAAVAEANARLCENNAAEMFVTAWIGAYDRKTRVVRYVNAGHNPPLVKRAGGAVEWVRTRPCAPLAAVEGAKYRVETLALAAGDTLLLYTDGVTEATNAGLELYGEHRLEAAVAAADKKVVDAIRTDVDRFVAGAEQADDITLLAFDVK